MSSASESKQEWERGWKVLWTGIYDDGLFSCSPVATRVKYEPGKEARSPPGCGPLTVFCSRDHASEFKRMYSGDYWRIVPCRYIPSGDLAVWNETGGIRELSKLPQGTVLADVVMLENVE